MPSRAPPCLGLPSCVCAAAWCLARGRALLLLLLCCAVLCRRACAPSTMHADVKDIKAVVNYDMPKTAEVRCVRACTHPHAYLHALPCECPQMHYIMHACGNALKKTR